MRVAMALKAEGVLSDRVWYCLHQLIAGNAGTKELNDPFAPMQAQPAKRKAW